MTSRIHNGLEHDLQTLEAQGDLTGAVKEVGVQSEKKNNIKKSFWLFRKMGTSSTCSHWFKRGRVRHDYTWYDGSEKKNRHDRRLHQDSVTTKKS